MRLNPVVDPSITRNIHDNTRGESRIFIGGGGGGGAAATQFLVLLARISRARSTMSHTAGVQGLLKGPGNFSDLDPIPCYLSLIFQTEAKPVALNTP